jgi:hypothetical protein
MLYVFVVIEHGIRRLAHVNATARPSAEWTLQKLREVILDNGTIRRELSFPKTCGRRIASHYEFASHRARMAQEPHSASRSLLTQLKTFPQGQDDLADLFALRPA